MIDALQGAKGRGKDGLSLQQLEQLNNAVRLLEADSGITSPTTSELIDGQWRLLYTSRPGSASPIQRTFTGVEAFGVFQEVTLADGQQARVNNIVSFGSDIGALKVRVPARWWLSRGAAWQRYPLGGVLQMKGCQP